VFLFNGVDLCEILCFSVKRHTFRVKYYLLASKISSSVLLLLKSKEAFLRLSALRFFRSCIGVKDEYYNRHFIKHDVFGPIISSFIETKAKYNLFNSACLELFEFIRKENLKSLITFLYEKYSTMLRGIVYVDTFSLLLLRHEQGIEEKRGDEAGGATVVEIGVLKREDARREDDYFAGSDDEGDGGRKIAECPSDSDDSEPFPGFTRKLVDYADDDEDILVGGKRKSSPVAVKVVEKHGDENGGKKRKL
jgi:protein phosphatase-4 regulatory subunit 3